MALKDKRLEIATSKDGRQWWVGEMEPPVISPKAWIHMDDNWKPTGWRIWNGKKWVKCTHGQAVNKLDEIKP